MTRGRLEAFSEGVLAVAITMLVLDLHAQPRVERLDPVQRCRRACPEAGAPFRRDDRVASDAWLAVHTPVARNQRMQAVPTARE